MKLVGGLNLTDGTSVSINVACEPGGPSVVALVDRLETRLDDICGLKFTPLPQVVSIRHENRLTVSALEACELVGWAVMTLTQLEQDTGFEYSVEVWTAMEW